MNTDGNTAAIERMMAEREEHDERREAEQELQDLRDEVDALVAKLAEVTEQRDEADMLVRACFSDASENNIRLAEASYRAKRAEAAETALATARRDALEEAAKVAVDYGKVQFSANIENHPQYASDAADDALEIANAIRALTTEGKGNE